MKCVLLLMVFILTMSCQAETSAPTAQKATETAEAAPKNEEDCDDKAKKPIEIKEDSISLTGNTGCTLDEAAGSKPPL